MDRGSSCNVRWTVQQRVRNHCFARVANLLEQLVLEIVRHGHLAGRDLGRIRRGEAKLAAAECATFHANRRPKDAASHRSPRVHVATSGDGVQRGTGGLVGTLLKLLALPFRLREHPRFGIAGENWRELPHPRFRPQPNGPGKFRIAPLQLVHARPKPRNIKRVDAEWAVAALRASGSADKVRTRAALGLGERGIHDLYKLLVACRKAHKDPPAAGADEKQLWCRGTWIVSEFCIVAMTARYRKSRW